MSGRARPVASALARGSGGPLEAPPQRAPVPPARRNPTLRLPPSADGLMHNGTGSPDTCAARAAAYVARRGCPQLQHFSCSIRTRALGSAAGPAPAAARIIFCSPRVEAMARINSPAEEAVSAPKLRKCARRTRTLTTTRVPLTCYSWMYSLHDMSSSRRAQTLLSSDYSSAWLQIGTLQTLRIFQTKGPSLSTGGKGPNSSLFWKPLTGRAAARPHTVPSRPRSGLRSSPTSSTSSVC